MPAAHSVAARFTISAEAEQAEQVDPAAADVHAGEQRHDRDQRDRDHARARAPPSG